LAASITLVAKWPFSQQSVTDSIHEIVSGTIQMGRFRNRIFPHPGCEAYDVVVTRMSGTPGQSPLVTVKRISIEARYSDLFARPGFVARIVLNGLRVHVPPRGSGENAGTDSSGRSGSEPTKTRVGEIVAEGALLEIGRQGGHPPLKFDIHSLVLKSVSRDKPFSYTLSLTNAIPPGEITSQGRFGPWNTTDAGQTPVSGSYKFQQADLSTLAGISGMLSSEDKFSGRLNQIDTRGSIEIPDFKIKERANEIPLRARYIAAVNAINGDVFLHQVTATFLHTTIVASGDIAGHPGKKGKITSLKFEAHDGRIEDVLRLFVKEATPPMSGAAVLHANVLVAPEGRPFLREVSLRGDFTIAGGHFNHSHTQASVDDLSQRARGQGQGEKNAGDRQSVTSDMESQVVLRNGAATLTNLSFKVPGALAHMNGTYDLFTSKVDFHGTLKTEAELSQETTGLKSILLKPLNPIFKKKKAGAEVPVRLTGTYADPHFGFDIDPVHKR
jgi:hypothetical protein